MTIFFRGRMFTFRECDVEGMTEAHVIKRADECGELVTQVSGLRVRTYLFVRGIGYAWEQD